MRFSRTKGLSGTEAAREMFLTRSRFLISTGPRRPTSTVSMPYLCGEIKSNACYEWERGTETDSFKFMELDQMIASWQHAIVRTC